MPVPTSRERTQTMKIPELLHPEAIFVNLDAADSTAVITELGNRLLKLGAVKEGFVEATLAREASMPTGLPLMGEFNAALPHVDIEYVNRPALALATLRSEEHTSELQSRENLVCRLLLEKKKNKICN